MGAIGPLQIAVVVLVLLLLFGASRLPKIGKGLGQGLRDFKKGLGGEDLREATKQLKEAKVTVENVSSTVSKKTV